MECGRGNVYRTSEVRSVADIWTFSSTSVALCPDRLPPQPPFNTETQRTRRHKRRLLDLLPNRLPSTLVKLNTSHLSVRVFLKRQLCIYGSR